MIGVICTSIQSTPWAKLSPEKNKNKIAVRNFFIVFIYTNSATKVVFFFHIHQKLQQTLVILFVEKTHQTHYQIVTQC